MSTYLQPRPRQYRTFPIYRESPETIDASEPVPPMAIAVKDTRKHAYVSKPVLLTSGGVEIALLLAMVLAVTGARTNPSAAITAGILMVLFVIGGGIFMLLTVAFLRTPAKK